MTAKKSSQNEQTKQTPPKPKAPEQLEQAVPVFLPPTTLPAMIWRAENAPESLTSSEARYLQRVMGNQAVNQLDAKRRENSEEEGGQPVSQAESSLHSILGRTAVISGQSETQQSDPTANGSSAKKSSPIQPKLKVNEPDDAFEQEADEMAEAVLRQPMPAAAPPPDDDDGDETNPAHGSATPQPGSVQRQGDALSGQAVPAEVEQRIAGLDGGGAPLPEQERQLFESRMGADFSDVRLHTNEEAAQLSQDINARAFTVGPNIAFGEGEYQPGSSAGRELLAHELTHTIQQGAADQDPAAARQLQRQETAETEEEGPTEEEKAAALAAAAAAEQMAQSVRATSQSQTEQSEASAQAEKEAAAAPQDQVAASLAEGPVTPEAEQAREAAMAEQAQEAAQVTEQAEQEAVTQTQQVMETAVPQAQEDGPPPAPGGGAPANGAAGPAPLPVGGEPAPGSGDPASATVAAQTAVADAFTQAENPPDKAPDSPEADPGYQGVATATEAVAEEQQTHEPAEGASAQAQEAVIIPPAEVESRAQGDQVGEMETAETPGFDAAAFKAALMARIAELAPRSAEEADEFKESDALGGVKTEMQGQVEGEKSNAADPMTEAATAPPDTGAVEVREATPLEPAEPGPAPTSVNAENAAPPPRGQGEVEVPLEAGSQSIDQQMQDAEITEEQLANANEPEFATALEAKGEAQTAVAETPQQARQEESDLIAATQSEAVTTASNALTDMHSQRTEGFASVSTQQTETMSQDEQKRAEIAAHITGIYERTKTNVEAILSRLDTEVAQLFDAGAKEAEEAFENYVDARMEAYKEERYGGWLGWAKWAKDKLLGMPGEVNAFYSEGRQLYLDKMDAVIDNVVALIGKTLAEAKAEVANGKQEIQTYVDQLPQDLQTVGQEAADAIQSRFDELEQQIDAKQNELIDTLAQKYNESLQAIDARIEEMKAANRGLIDKAIDAIGAVIGTILELKNLLMQVLASVADAVMTILSDPIGFIGNLISAIGQGLQNFVSNIATHLQTGFIEWLTGTLGGAGIQLPEDLFSLEGIFDLVLQILGLTWNAIRSRAVAILGEPVVNALETGFEMFMIIKEQGLAGLWEYVQEHIATLQETVIDGIKEMLMTEVVEAGVQWLIGLLGGPAGAFIKAAKMIYDIIMWFINNASRIASLVQSIVQSVGAIAAGNLSAAAEYVEQSLARFLPVAIGFLASLIGIGDLATKVRKIIDKVQEPINAAIDWLLDKAKQAAQRIGRALGLSVGDEADQGDGRTGDGEVGQTVNFSADGEGHRLWYNVQGESATLMVASETVTVETKIQQWENSLNENPDLLGENAARARTLLETAKNLLGIAEQEGDEAAKEKQEADADQANDQKEAEFDQADQEAEQAQENISDVLRQLFEIFGEEAPELAGDAKIKFDQVMADRHIPNATRDQYRNTVFVQLVQAGPGADQYGILKSVAAQGDYFAKGPDIPVNEIEAKGGMTRVIPLRTIWADNLDPAYKAQFSTFEDWLGALAADQTVFDPNAHLNPGSTVPGQYATAWWAPRSQQQGNTMAELIEELALNPASYEGGCVRVTVSAAASQTAGFKKPTALDGIFFMEFAPAPNNVWGITGGGSLEAVAPRIAVSDVSQKEFLPGQLPPPRADVERAIQDAEQPHLTEDGGITKENAETVAQTVMQENSGTTITVKDGGETWDYEVQRTLNRPKAEGDGNESVWNELNQIKSGLVMPKSIKYFEELVAQHQENPEQALNQLKAEDARSNVHPQIRSIREQSGLGPNIEHSPTVAILEGNVPGLGNVAFSGISGQFGTTVVSDLRLNAVSPTHAEGRVLAQLANAMKAQNVQGGTVTIFVDKAPCGFCKGALTSMKNQYGVTINIVSS